MNVFDNLLTLLQGLATHVPGLLQPVVIAVAGTIPFVEGEFASLIGVWSGMHPVIAGLAAATGNFLCVAFIVVFGTRVREMLLARRARKSPVAPSATRPPRESAGRLRLRRYIRRYGVPGASLLGPLAVPTQITSAILVSTGASKRWILLWQAVAILLWTSAVTLVAAGALNFAG